ncbi:MAG: hypothetical protein GYB67_18980, partial [Chloroflexi bacterium]|nr:hypothetical protein [Chloroflexota bacterium]
MRISRTTTWLYLLLGLIAVLAVSQLSGLLAVHAACPVDTVIRTSVSDQGIEGNAASLGGADLDSAGDFIVFASDADNLVAGDTNDVTDVFLFDRLNCTIELISAAAGGGPADGPSFNPTISGNGQIIAYTSSATNLVSDDTNGVDDIFIFSRQAVATFRVSVNDNLDEADGPSDHAALSNNGRFVVFQSDATNLIVDGTGTPLDTNNATDIYLRNRNTGETTRQSVLPTGVQVDGASRLPDISANGEQIVFESDSPNLASGDNNNTTDVFLREPLLDRTVVLSVRIVGFQPVLGNGPSTAPTISSDGVFVVFQTTATNLRPGVDTNGDISDILLRDLSQPTADMELISVTSDVVPEQGNFGSFSPQVSVNGDLVIFASQASNFAVDDNNGVLDVFVRDRPNSATFLVSRSSTAALARGGASFSPAISDSGEYVVFTSGANNLVMGDANGVNDVFVSRWRALEAPTPTPTEITPSATSTGTITATNTIDPLTTTFTPTSTWTITATLFFFYYWSITEIYTVDPLT